MTLPSPLPSLPAIPSEEIHRQVFAHVSSLIFTANAANPQSNERLEFLGDSYLNFCISNILYHAFPTLTPGELTALRSGIVSNANLNTWARAYGLQNHLVMGYSLAYLQIPEKAEKLIADVFEAYIGGVIVSNPLGRTLVEEFLTALVQPVLEEQKLILDETVKVDKMAVSKLYEVATAQKKTLKFDFEDAGLNSGDTRWEAICLWNGQELGRAKGRNQQEAKHRVAAKVLHDMQNQEE
jgi:dsRNA-specific ribonuclease